MSGLFRKAERRKAKLKLALAATAGGGKTHSALLMAAGLVDNPSEENIAVLDTENGSAELEAGKPGVPGFSVVTMPAPYSPDRYIEVINEAVKAGFEVLILDSISPEWNGNGGILDIVDKKKQSARNQMAAWKDATPMHQRFLDAIIQAPIHIIATMRAKTAYEISNENGKSKVQKLGTAPTQRDGIEFEFTLVGEINVHSHLCDFTKDRTGLFASQVPEMITTETGKRLRAWLEGGVAAETPDAPEFNNASEEVAPEVPSLVVEKVYLKKAKGAEAMVLAAEGGEEFLLPDELVKDAKSLIGEKCHYRAMARKGLHRLVEIKKAA